MGVVTEVAEVHPDTKDLPSKNRVWGFRTPARYRIRKSAAQVAETRRENAPTPTNIVSGIGQFLLTDQVGTLRAVADTSGAIVKRIDYDSFGDIIADSNPSFSVPFGFAGGLHDRDTGLVRFGARDYDPAIGRFTAKDPIDFAGGDTNLYGYVMNDPVNWVDPYGLDRYSDTVTVVTSVADVGVGYLAPPTTPAGAAAFAVGIAADKANSILAFNPDGNAKACIGTALSAVGAGAALIGTSPVSAFLSGFGLGTSINGLPVYGSDKTLGDWWVDTLLRLRN